MKCPVCNFENSDDSRFCMDCGKSFPRCPTCGVVLTTRDRFCVRDGTRLSDELLMQVPVTLQNDDGFEQVDVQPAGGAVVQRALREEIEIPVNPTPAASCLRCGSPVWQGETYCVGCRNLEQEEEPVCASCGMPCEAGEDYCSYCRPSGPVPVENMDYIPYESYDRPKKKKSSALVVILVILLMLLIGAAAVLVASEFDLIELPDIFGSEDSGRDRDSDDEDDEDTEDTSGNGGYNDPGDPGNGSDTREPTAATTAPTTAPTTVATEPTTQPTQPVQTKLEYFMENCDSMYFEESDIVGFSKQDCHYARNACYAQRGRKFKNKELQEYFEQYYWYSPTYEPAYFDEHEGDFMNNYAKANRKLISAYEKEMGYK